MRLPCLASGPKAGPERLSRDLLKLRRLMAFSEHAGARTVAFTHR
jgi:hypothetical protein